MSFFSLGVLSAVVISIFRILKDVKNDPTMLENAGFKGTYEILTEDLNLHPKDKIKNIALYWNGLILLRWVATVFILIYLKDFNCF